MVGESLFWSSRLKIEPAKRDWWTWPPWMIGVDIDWEYPAEQGIQGNQVDRDDSSSMLLFFELLREKLGPSKIISAAVTDYTFKDNHDHHMTDVAPFGKVLDHILVMLVFESFFHEPHSHSHLSCRQWFLWVGITPWTGIMIIRIHLLPLGLTHPSQINVPTPLNPEETWSAPSLHGLMLDFQPTRSSWAFPHMATSTGQLLPNWSTGVMKCFQGLVSNNTLHISIEGGSFGVRSFVRTQMTIARLIQMMITQALVKAVALAWIVKSCRPPEMECTETSKRIREHRSNSTISSNGESSSSIAQIQDTVWWASMATSWPGMSVAQRFVEGLAPDPPSTCCDSNWCIHEFLWYLIHVVICLSSHFSSTLRFRRWSRLMIRNLLGSSRPMHSRVV